VAEVGSSTSTDDQKEHEKVKGKEVIPRLSEPCSFELPVKHDIAQKKSTAEKKCRTSGC